MTAQVPQLSANPLQLVRQLPTSLVPLDQLKAPEGVSEDEIFLSKYVAFLRGKVPLHETRASLSTIRRGLWKRDGDNWTLVDDLSLQADVDHVVDLIRLGSRPVLYLYENPNPGDDKRFVCTDDTVVHAAYERLGISKVPVVVMAKPRDLEESSLSIRCFPRKGKDPVVLLDGTVSVTHQTVPSILGSERGEPADSLNALLAAIGQVKRALKSFHKPGATALHYHHTLYSVLLRAEECVDSMRLLIAANRPLIAAGLLRSLHDLALVFYVDWLAPGHTYRYLQMASVTTEKDWEARCEAWRKEAIADGTPLIDAKNIKDAHMRAFRLCCIVGERARLFPLGERLQRDVYSFLSDVVHHDFSMTARYTHTLDHGDEAVYHTDATRTIVHVADILVAAIVSRISDDIGANHESLSA
jgi:hypothetical protein